MMKNLILISFLLFSFLELVVCFKKDECIFSAWQRIECGWSGISAFRCRNKGCCWDDSVLGEIYCFKSSERMLKKGLVARVNHFDHPFSPMPLAGSDETSSMMTCTIRREDRVECGWQPMSRDACEERGCCFDRTSEDGPSCYMPESLLIGSHIRTLLHCTWECSRMYWKRISGGYTKCGTNPQCWKREVGQGAGICLKACKTKTGFDMYLRNITRCLELNDRDAAQTIKECATHLPCWIEYHGQPALDCFKYFDKNEKVFNLKTSNEKAKKQLPSSKRPFAVPSEPQPTRNKEIPPELPEEQGPAPKVNKPSISLRTATNVERSVHNRPLINTEE